MITPGLSQDPVAISLIQDPELLVRMGHIETVRRFVTAALTHFFKLNLEPVFLSIIFSSYIHTTLNFLEMK
jgi:ABC-type protease/lipase transport system fused ATPase/permease subunit